MPVVTENKRVLFAHCPSPLCANYRQQEVEGVVVETSYMFTDNGGDIPGIERSVEDLRWVDDDQAECSECGRRRELSTSPRPSYDPLSGHDPMGLVNGTVPPYDPGKVNTPEDERFAELQAQLKAQQAMIEKLLADKTEGGD